MVPERWARIAGRTACRVYRGPKKFVVIWRVASLSLQKVRGTNRPSLYIGRYLRDILAGGQDGVASNIDQIVNATKGVNLACNAVLRLCHI